MKHLSMNTWVWTQQSVCYPHLLHLRTLGGLVWFLCNVYLRTSTPVKTTGDYNTPHSKELWHSRDSPSFKICSVQQNHTVGLLRLRGPQSSLLPSPSPFRHCCPRSPVLSCILCSFLVPDPSPCCQTPTAHLNSFQDLR